MNTITLILGAQGTGKTTMARQLAQDKITAEIDAKSSVAVYDSYFKCEPDTEIILLDGVPLLRLDQIIKSLLDMPLAKKRNVKAEFIVTCQCDAEKVESCGWINLVTVKKPTKVY